MKNESDAGWHRYFYILILCFEEHQYIMKITKFIIISALILNSCSKPLEEEIIGTWELSSFEGTECHLETGEFGVVWYEGDIAFNEPDEMGCANTIWGISSVLAPSCNITFEIVSPRDVKLNVTDLYGERLELDYHYSLIISGDLEIVEFRPFPNFPTDTNPFMSGSIEGGYLKLSALQTCITDEMRFRKI